MRLPQFTAEASQFRSSHLYGVLSGRKMDARAAGPRSVSLAGSVNTQFVCDSQSCMCAGLGDCGDMFGTNVCGPGAQCDSTGGLLTCQCFRP